MADEKYLRPALRRDAPRARLETPARERPKFSVRVEPVVYQQLVDSAAARNITLSTEVERRLKRSFDHDLVEASKNPWLTTFGLHVTHAFEMGGRMGEHRDHHDPECEWRKDRAAYKRAAMRGFEALLDEHPQLDRDNFYDVIRAIVDRYESAFVTAEKTEAARRRGEFPYPRPSPESGQEETTRSPSTEEKKD